jgi:hypothetical protein
MLQRLPVPGAIEGDRVHLLNRNGETTSERNG